MSLSAPPERRLFPSGVQATQLHRTGIAGDNRSTRVRAQFPHCDVLSGTAGAVLVRITTDFQMLGRSLGTSISRSTTRASLPANIRTRISNAEIATTTAFNDNSATKKEIAISNKVRRKKATPLVEPDPGAILWQLRGISNRECQRRRLARNRRITEYSTRLQIVSSANHMYVPLFDLFRQRAHFYQPMLLVGSRRTRRIQRVLLGRLTIKPRPHSPAP